MAARTTDINLIIKARDEAGAAITNVAGALESLLGDAKGANIEAGALAKTLADLDKAAGVIGASVEKASSALARQTGSIAENKAALASLVAQQEASAAAAEHIQSAIVDQHLAGQGTEELVARLRALGDEQQRLTTLSARLGETIRRQEADLNGAQSGLLKLSSTSHAVAEAQAEAQARIELTNHALAEQADAATRVSAVQQRINDLTGVNRPDASGSAEAVSGILLAADAEYRLAEARQANLLKLREEEAASASAADAQRRNQQFTQFMGVTPNPNGSQARVSASVFQDAAAADEAQRVREAAQAYEMFEARVRAGAAALKEEEAAARAASAAEQADAKREAAHAYEMFEAAVRRGAAALRESEDAQRRDAAEAQNLRDKLDPLAAIQNRFNAALERYKQLASDGKISASELAAAETHLAEEAEKARKALDANGGGGGKLGLFGLRPYELQNLSYQINDVVTGLASGQHFSQVLAQQGGQILQLFPKVGDAIIGALGNPAILAFIGTIGTIALAVSHAADEAERLREITASLKLSADGASYDPAKLEAAAKALHSYGASAADADAAVKVLVASSVNSDRIVSFGLAAEHLSEVTGTKLPDAAKQLADAFTGGYDAIVKLDEKTNFLTATQRENIKAMFDEGRAADARTTAFNLFSQKVEEAAGIQRGPATDAANSLSKAYSDVLDTLGRTSAVQGVIGFFNGLGDAISRATGNASTFASNADRLKRIADLTKQINDLKYLNNPSGEEGPGLRDALAPARAELAQLQAQIKAQQASRGPITSGNSEAEKKAREDQLREIGNQDELQRLRDAGQVRLLTAAEKARREELAGVEAAKSASDSIVAAAEKRRAIAHETAQIDKESDARSKAAAVEREKTIRDFTKAVGGAEGGAGQNPFSSAVGIGQLTRDTAIGVYKSANPDTKLSNDQIADLRRDPAIAQKLVDILTRQNASFLDKLGVTVNGANLYLVHFLGQGGAAKALGAQPDTPVNQIGLSKDALTSNQGYLRTDNGKGRYRTVSELQTFLGGKIDNSGSSATTLIADEAKLLDHAQSAQDAFNQSIRHGVEDRKDSIKALQEESALYGERLIAVQRAAAVENADRELRQKTEDANKSLKPGQAPVVVSPEQIQQVKDLAGALFDAQHARELLNARAADAQRPIDDLTQQRDLLKSQADFLRSIGENEAADKLDKQIQSMSSSIRQAYDALIAFYEQLTPVEQKQLGIITVQQLQNIIDKLKEAKQSSQDWGKVLGISGQQIAQAFASSAVNAITNFIDKVAAGKNVFKSLAESIREFAASFIISIAQMILQLLAYAAAVKILQALGVPVPAAVVGVHHAGGIAGSAGGVQRSVSPAIFGAALRYHTGGVAGLAPDEVPAILKQGEEVLTTGDPRHRANGGLGQNGGASPPGNIKVVNAYNPSDVLQHALADDAGQKVILNFVSKNPRAFKAALGGS